MEAPQQAPEKQGLAITAEALYMLNLLFPVLPLFALGVIYFRHRNDPSLFVRSHVIQPWIAALISTALFFLINLIAALAGGYTSLDNLISIHSLVALEVYTLLVILPFLVPGLLALTRAMSGQAWRYPLIGRFL
ncbi:hypothetical protein [Thiolapillus sp.]|uniref:DUF4870 domain-containing protein n=2 Tax=Thiolapillus TaxID=1608298 RepID=A0A831RY98_9GAMM|nr:hypothetical protein [Thiolapillus sp.]HEC07452.1 hypothetical protein [Thiolapillus brandeum]